jgi:ferredoxin
MAPRFTIIDGIIAMEGQGPGGGEPRELGSLFAARDCVALDAALADRTAHRRRDVQVLAAAERRGLVDLDDAYTLAGDAIEPATDFVPAGRDVQDRVPAGLRRLGRQFITARPQLVDAAACTECGECAQICGASAIALAPRPIFDDHLCVRCYACTEVCPTRAIDNVTPRLARFLAGH